MSAADSWHFAGEFIHGIVMMRPALGEALINQERDRERERHGAGPRDRFPGDADLRARMRAADALDREELERLLAVTRKNREVGKP